MKEEVQNYGPIHSSTVLKQVEEANRR